MPAARLPGWLPAGAHLRGGRGCDAGFLADPRDGGAKGELAVAAVVVAARAVFQRDEPVVPVRSHDGFEVLEHAEIEWVFAGLAVEDRELFLGSRGWLGGVVVC